MSYVKSLFFVALFLGVSLGCENNIMSEFADKTTDEAILFDAREDLNRSRFTAAIAKFALLTPAFANRRDVVALRASAYAGRCGLDFLDLVSSLDDLGNTRLLLFFMRTYVDALLDEALDCLEAETLLKSIGLMGQRNVDENLLMVFVSFVKIGRVLSLYADTDNDEQVDAGFDSCDNTDIPDQAVAEVATGLANALTSLTATGSDIAGAPVTMIEDICDEIESFDPDYNFCNVTETQNLTPEHIRAVRTIIGENVALGLGSCTGDFQGCLCP